MTKKHYPRTDDRMGWRTKWHVAELGPDGSLASIRLERSEQSFSFQ